ncbi:MAG: SGNH/GDSL hydrolase family protein [Candidatus Omnitrophica bacterium]|nr:SGNH/GDSL hydrolase family protein [Candidatus Omnitrophota bacterium]
MKTLIIGHSFVQKYRRYLRKKEKHTDIGIPADFSQHFGLRPGYSVHIQGRSGLCIDGYGKYYISDRIDRLQPQVVIIELGTNDIVNNLDPADIAYRIKSYCKYLLEETSVEFIVLVQVIERRKTRICDKKDVDKNKSLLNAILQRFAKYNRNVYVFRHDKNLIVKLQKDSISEDDIHITTQQGLEYYHFSIRRAITIAQTKLLEYRQGQTRSDQEDVRIVQYAHCYEQELVKRKERVYSMLENQETIRRRDRVYRLMETPNY